MARGRWITPDSTGDSNIARCLSVPENLQPAINGALQLLTFPENWEQVGDLTPEECADAATEFLNSYYESEPCPMTQVYPENALIMPFEGVVQVGNPQSFVVAAGNIFNGEWKQTPAQQYDEIEYKTLLRSGVYDVNIIAFVNSQSGRMDWYVDGDIQTGFVELYNAANARNVVRSMSIEIPTDGWHTLLHKMNTKHSSSTGYLANVVSIYLQRTGDI